MQIENCKPMDLIMVNQYVKIIVLDIKSSRIKLGVQTPKDLQVHRKEIHRKIQLELSSS